MNDFIQMRQIAVILARRWWLIVLSVALSTATGFVISRNLPPIYEATSTLLVGQSIQAANLDSGDLQIGEQLAVTYAEVGLRQPVLKGVVETLELDRSWQQLRKQVRITPINGTQLLEITVEATSPAEARIIADEIARQMILLSPAQTPSEAEAESRLFLEERLASLRLRIENGQLRIEELEGEMANLRTAAALAAYQTEINSLEQMITGWEGNYAQLLTLLESSSTANYLAVMETAEANPEPVRPRVGLNTLLAGSLGMVLALGAIILREYTDDTLKTTDDLQQELGLTPLGAVSQIRVKGYQGKLLSSLSPFSATSEAFNVIRSNIRFASENTLPGVILITSPGISEGKSLTAANLGLAMARSGLNTVIVDADLRQPAQHLIFEISNVMGVAELLRSTEFKIEGYLSRTGVDSLKLINSGETPPNPSELLGSEQMELLLARLVDEFEVVIMDCPPVLTGADAAVLSNRVDAVIMVVQAGRTRRHEARRSLAILQQAGATVLGAVLNRASRGSLNYHYMFTGGAIGQDGDMPAPYIKRLRKWNLGKLGMRGSAKGNFNGRHGTEPVSDTGGQGNSADE